MQTLFNKLFSWCYNGFIFLLALTYLPKLFFRTFSSRYPKEFFLHKLGIGLNKELKKFRGAVWIHAVSLGEVRAIQPLVQEITKQHPSFPLVLSTMTETGYSAAKKLMPNAFVFFLPLDFSFLLRPLARALCPKWLLFCETDLWYHQILAVKEQKGLVAQVSAKLSKRSLERWKKGAFFCHKMYRLVDQVLAQDKLYYHRFLELGIPESRLRLTGNLKYDTTYPLHSEEEKETLRQTLGVQECIVIASTHPGEEEKLLEQLLGTAPLLLVPRHPHRFNEVAELLERNNISYWRYTQMETKPDSFEVILIDTMGKLLSLYEIATLAVVAGSFSPSIGGHNLLEPLAYGTPTLFGPHMFTQEEMTNLVLEADAGIQVTYDSISATVKSLLNDDARQKRLGLHGKELVASLQGVAQETLNSIHLISLSINK